MLVGSPMLSAALEQLGLIDEYRLAVHPIVAGHGPTLFSGFGRSWHMRILEVRRFKSGVIAMRYRKAKSGR